MGITEDVGKLRGNAQGSQDFLKSFLKKFPQHQSSFPKYKGVAPDSMGTVSSFAGHALAVVNKMCDVAANAGGLKAEAAALAKMPQHTGLKAGQFKDLVAHVGDFLPGADKAAWTAFANKLEVELKQAGM